ncbi:expressed unknown protein [Seminavis robusta]|uniref:Uncharacterized protein n=1 Tax=Seminavis robusta TaxID=568900 RepID=A0A9N8HU68_9STRA|nr:expressed unknown protein [Seminavis robusta]|eukprot:Sro1612_g285980.1 n/a (163) ;mRNA; f:10675-11163
MKLFALLQPLLLALGKKPTHWFLDGNNILAHGKTVKDREALVATLRDVKAEEVILVFDGKAGQQTNIAQEDALRTVDLGEGLESDDYIKEEIEKFLQDPKTRRKHRVNLVSADRELRRKAKSFKPIVRTVVNPVTFFKKYLPRLKGLKGPNDNLPQSDDQEY